MFGTVSVVVIIFAFQAKDRGSILLPFKFFFLLFLTSDITKSLSNDFFTLFLSVYLFFYIPPKSFFFFIFSSLFWATNQFNSSKDLALLILIFF